MAWRLTTSCVLPVLMGCYFGCGGSQAERAATAEPPSAAAEILPQLAVLQPAPLMVKRGSALTGYELLDSSPVLQSVAGAAYSAGELTLSPPAGEIAWAVFGLSGLATDGSAYPTRLAVSADAQYWVALGDYGAESWRFLPYEASGIYSITGGAACVSSGGSCYVAVVGWQQDVTLSQLTLSIQDDSGPMELWLYLQKNLYVEANLAAAIELVERAADAGYTTVVIADYKLGVIDLYDEEYTSNLQEFVVAANAVGVDVVPSLVPIGYSSAFFAHDPNLIEGQPVIDCAFCAQGGVADVVQNPASAIVNGGFEDRNGDNFAGWNQMDGPGVSTFADTGDYHSGGTSIRFENFTAGNEHGNDRIRQNLTVDPWQCYALSFWLRTDGVSPVGQLWARVYNDDVSEQLTFLTFDIDATQDWRQYHLIFNSQNYDSVALYMGIWSGESGRFWLDDVAIENTGLINLIRRSGAPLTVTSADGGTTYQEGSDFEYVSDPLLGEAGAWTGTFDLYHERPVITLTPGSSISEGEDLLVDYYHAAFVYDMQGACCLSEQGVFDIIDTTLTKVNDLVAVDKVFIAVDELRCANWCALCQAQGLTPGALLAAATGRINLIAAGINPGWTLMTWSDMYDPYHNAHADYYLANGTFAESWQGLPAAWEIGNWRQFGDRTETLSFFAVRGHRQVLAGYYDRGIPDPVLADWLSEAADYPGVYAAMYTTWSDDFSNIEAWAQAVRDWEAAQE